MTITTADNVTHALEESGNGSVWMVCAPWRAVHGSLARVWNKGIPQSRGNVDCMTCLVELARCGE